MANRTSIPYPVFAARDTRTDTPLAGGKVYTYEVGTTTPKAAYTDPELAVPHTNPIILDANGEAVIYLSGAYKFVIDASDDTNMRTLDKYEIADPSATGEYGLDSGIADAYAVNNVSMQSYTPGAIVRFKAGTDNTGASTINVNSLGVKSIVTSDGAPLEARMIQASSVYTAIYDGAAFQLQSYDRSGLIDVQTFTANGTWNRPTGTRFIEVEVQGAGGGGVGVDIGAATNAGAAGGYVKKLISSGFGTSQTVTVGTGGAGSADRSTNGTNGGASSFGALVTAGGGQGGQVSAGARGIATGGTATGGDINIVGGFGGSFKQIQTGGSPELLPGKGGDSFFGHGGEAVGVLTGSSAGVDGVGYGSGGSGSASVTGTPTESGGDGKDGIVIVKSYR